MPSQLLAEHENGSPFSNQALLNSLKKFRQTTHIVFDPVKKIMGVTQNATPAEQVVGSLPGMYPEWLGDRCFQASHNVRFAYVGGAMARGIASAELVIALGKTGCLAFFGSAGLSILKIEAAIQKIKKELDPINASWGINLIHTPATPEKENALIDLYLQYGVKRISAAAFMGSNKALIRFVCKGLSRDSKGIVKRKHFLFPKVSRTEVAQHFLKPPTKNILEEMITEGLITHNEAQMAAEIPLAADLTVESDSGGHTDGRPLNSLFSAMTRTRDTLQHRYNFLEPVRLGAAGSLGTPESIAAAFSLGASYVLLGSVHQSALESGLSDIGKSLLAQMDITDTIKTPSADMFEIGGRVQVLKKGSMMGVRGNRLLEIYKRYPSVEKIPARIRKELEQSIFRENLDTVWQDTVNFFTAIDPREIERAEQNPKYKMALIFRWYLGNSSKWALTGEQDRQLDFQIWTGPAMGAFNQWVQGSFLENPGNRQIQQMALNLLEGAAHHTRCQQFRCFGVPVPSHLCAYKPQPMTL